MGRWGKVLLWLAGGIALSVVVVLAVALWMLNDLFSDIGEIFAGDAEPREPRIVHFLEAEGFDPASDGAALVLHPLATGGETLAITDPAALSAAAPTAFYTDDPGEELRLVLLSILFLSPPGNSTRSTFATLFQDGQEVTTFTCFRLHCEGADHQRDLAGLAEAARPVTYEIETVTGVEAIRARDAALRADPELLMVSGAEGQLSDPADRFPGFVRVTLPTRFGQISANPDAADEAWLDAIAADLSARMAEAGIVAEVDDVGTAQSWVGLHLTRNGEWVLDPEGYPVQRAYLPVADPGLRVWLAEADAPALREALQALRVTTPVPPTEAEIAAATADVIARAGLDLDPGDHELNVAEILTSGVIGQIRQDARAGAFREPEVIFGYYAVGQ